MINLLLIVVLVLGIFSAFQISHPSHAMPSLLKAVSGAVLSEKRATRLLFIDPRFFKASSK
jgi:hypothetical protein